MKETDAVTDTSCLHENLELKNRYWAMQSIIEVSPQEKRELLLHAEYLCKDCNALIIIATAIGIRKED
jgi:hypothetical protein